MTSMLKGLHVCWIRQEGPGSFFRVVNLQKGVYGSIAQPDGGQPLEVVGRVWNLFLGPWRWHHHLFGVEPRWKPHDGGLFNVGWKYWVINSYKKPMSNKFSGWVNRSISGWSIRPSACNSCQAEISAAQKDRLLANLAHLDVETAQVPASKL